MAANDPGSAPANPDWPRDAWRALRGDVVEFVLIVWRTTTAPVRFYAEWADGRRRALNPLAATLNAIGVMTAWMILLAHLRHVELPAYAWWLEPLTPIFYMLSFTAFAVACHGALWLFGARRPLRTTIGAVLYVWCGPGLVLTIVEGAIVADPRNPGRLAYVDLIAHVLLSLAVILALAGAQQRRSWRLIVPLLLVFALQVLLLRR